MARNLSSRGDAMHIFPPARHHSADSLFCMLAALIGAAAGSGVGPAGACLARGCSGSGCHYCRSSGSLVVCERWVTRCCRHLSAVSTIGVDVMVCSGGQAWRRVVFTHTLLNNGPVFWII